MNSRYFILIFQTICFKIILLKDDFLLHNVNDTFDLNLDCIILDI